MLQPPSLYPSFASTWRCWPTSPPGTPSTQTPTRPSCKRLQTKILPHTHPPLKTFGGGRVEEEGGEGRWGGGGALEGWGELQLQLHQAEARLHPPTLCNRGFGVNRGARCCSQKKSGEREPQRLFLPLTAAAEVFRRERTQGGSLRTCACSNWL